MFSCSDGDDLKLLMKVTWHNMG